MKRTGRFVRALIGVAALLASTAFAANKGTMQVSSPVMVGEKRLPEGIYAVEWTGTGPDVQLMIKRNGKVLATTPARWVDLQSRSPYNAALIDTGGGQRSLLQIRFEGKMQALEIEKNSPDLTTFTTK